MAFIRGQRRPGAIGAQGLAVALVVATAAKESDWPDDWWESGVGQGVYLTLTALTGASAFLVAWGYRRGLTRDIQFEAVTKAANGVAKLVPRKTSLRSGEFGVNIWIVTGAPGFRRLVRWAEVAPDHARTPILWTKGKGVIGQAWKRKKSRVADLERVRSVYNEELWCREARDDRFRLTWDEFDETARYHAVVAVPIMVRRFAIYRVRGVIAIDALVGGKRDELEALEKAAAFSAIRRVCQSAFDGDEYNR